MSKQHLYKGKLIENIPYRSEPRWFIFEEDGKTRAKYKSGIEIYPCGTLKECKELLDEIKL